MKTDAECKINAIHVMEIEIKTLPRTNVVFNATYALATADDKGAIQDTHGRCTANIVNWSKKTMDLLVQLKESMERDLIPRHFNDVQDTKETETDAPARLEARGQEEPPQV